MNVFVVHHNPSSRRYAYGADPTDAVASAQALLDAGQDDWVAGNCRRMIQPGDLLLFKFGGSKLQQAPGIYAAAWVTRAAELQTDGTWRFLFAPDQALTSKLMKAPIVGAKLERIVSRSFGSSIQVVKDKQRAFALKLLEQDDDTRGLVVGDRITHGLLILKEPLDKILDGTKTWEIRGKATARRGPIALIQSKSGLVVGTCDVVDVVGPLSLAELRRKAAITGFRPTALPYATTYAWVVKNAKRLAKPVPYRHPPGAVIWVRLQPSELKAISRQCSAG